MKIDESEKESSNAISDHESFMEQVGINFGWNYSIFYKKHKRNLKNN